MRGTGRKPKYVFLIIKHDVTPSVQRVSTWKKAAAASPGGQGEVTQPSDQSPGGAHARGREAEPTPLTSLCSKPEPQPQSPSQACPAWRHQRVLPVTEAPPDLQAKRFTAPLSSG